MITPKKSTPERQARRFFLKKKWSKAIDEYQKCLNEDANNLAVVNLIGDAYYQKKNLEDAFDYYRQALSSYEAEGLFDNAIAMAKKISRLDPENADTHLKLAELYTDQAFLSDALTHLNTYVKTMGKRIDEKEVLAIFQKIAGMSIENPGTWDQIAECYHKLELNDPELDRVWAPEGVASSTSRQIKQKPDLHSKTNLAKSDTIDATSIQAPQEKITPLHEMDTLPPQSESSVTPIPLDQLAEEQEEEQTIDSEATEDDSQYTDELIAKMMSSIHDKAASQPDDAQVPDDEPPDNFKLTDILSEVLPPEEQLEEETELSPEEESKPEEIPTVPQLKLEDHQKISSEEEKALLSGLEPIEQDSGEEALADAQEIPAESPEKPTTLTKSKVSESDTASHLPKKQTGKPKTPEAPSDEDAEADESNLLTSIAAEIFPEAADSESPQTPIDISKDLIKEPESSRDEPDFSPSLLPGKDRDSRSDDDTDLPNGADGEDEEILWTLPFDVAEETVPDISIHEKTPVEKESEHEAVESMLTGFSTKEQVKFSKKPIPEKTVSRKEDTIVQQKQTPPISDPKPTEPKQKAVLHKVEAQAPDQKPLPDTAIEDTPESETTPTIENNNEAELTKSLQSLGLSELAELNRKVPVVTTSFDGKEHFDMGKVYKDMKLWDAAIAEFKTAASDPHWRAKSCIIMAQCLKEKGDMALAISQLKWALTTDDEMMNETDTYELHYELGYLYENVGDLNEAKEAFQAVHRWNPSHRNVEKKLMELRKKMQKS